MRMKKLLSFVLVLVLLNATFAFAAPNDIKKQVAEAEVNKAYLDVQENFSVELDKHYKNLGVDFGKLKKDKKTKINRKVLVDLTNDYETIKASYKEPLLIYEANIRISTPNDMDVYSLDATTLQTVETTTETDIKTTSYVYEGCTIDLSTKIKADKQTLADPDDNRYYIKMKECKYHWDTSEEGADSNAWCNDYLYIYSQLGLNGEYGVDRYEGTKYFNGNKSSGGHTSYVFPDFQLIHDAAGHCQTTAEYHLYFNIGSDWEVKKVLHNNLGFGDIPIITP